jgi:hypothetical protein
LTRPRLVAAALLALGGCTGHDGLVSPTLGAAFTLAPGEVARLEGTQLSVGFVAVESDSRCYSGPGPEVATVECVWEGVADAVVSVAQAAEPEAELHVQTTDSHGFSREVVSGAFRIRLVSLSPAPRLGPIPADEYRITLEVSRQ